MGQTDYIGWVDADGSGTRPKAFPKTPEAVALARQLFPTVFRAWRLESTRLSTALSGVYSAFADTMDYPQQSGPRPILKEQAQYLVTNIAAADSETNRMLAKLPIRLQVKGASESYYREAPKMGGLRVTGDGTIWVEGLAESVDGQDFCIYNGSLFDLPLSVTMKTVKLNAAMPMDHRVLGFKWDRESVLADSYVRSLEGLPLLYIDSPEAYHETHQVASEPAANPAFYSGTSTTDPSPLTRYLPPDSEQHFAEYAADRRLQVKRLPAKLSKWVLPGIRQEYFPGLWVGWVRMTGTTSDADYQLDAPIKTVLWDFVEQRTTIGGLAGVD
jgi:hypothetical protein